jgi:hypothetical protein
MSLIPRIDDKKRRDGFKKAQFLKKKPETKIKQNFCNNNKFAGPPSFSVVTNSCSFSVVMKHIPIGRNQFRRTNSEKRAATCQLLMMTATMHPAALANI